MMTPTQRAAAERLSNERTRVGGQLWGAEVVALLRELLAAETVHRCPACDSSETSDRHEWMCNECGEYFEVTP